MLTMVGELVSVYPIHFERTWPVSHSVFDPRPLPRPCARQTLQIAPRGDAATGKEHCAGRLLRLLRILSKMHV
jgi:hypothetical protein